METLAPDLITIAKNGGIAAILFVIWWFTFDRSNKQYDAAIKHSNSLYRESIEHSNRMFTTAMQQHQKKLDEITVILRDEVKAKELLAGAISRLEKAIEQVLSKSNGR